MQAVEAMLASRDAFARAFVGPPKPRREQFPGLSALLSSHASEKIAEPPSKRHQRPIPQAPGEFGEILTAAQAAAYLQAPLSTFAVWRCTNRVVLPYFKLGGSVRYRKADLDAKIEESTQAGGFTGETAEKVSRMRSQKVYG